MQVGRIDAGRQKLMCQAPDIAGQERRSSNSAASTSQPAANRGGGWYGGGGGGASQGGATSEWAVDDWADNSWYDGTGSTAPKASPPGTTTLLADVLAGANPTSGCSREM